MRRASLLVSFLLLSSLFADTAAAAPNTYCVGGFDRNSRACNSPQVRAQHRQWHFHNYVTNGMHCFECWDEHDSSCESDFLRNNRGTWREADRNACARLGAASPERIAALVTNGKPQPNPLEQEKQQRQQEIERQRQAAETARLEQERLAKEAAEREKALAALASQKAEQARIEAERRRLDALRQEQEAARRRAEEEERRRKEQEPIAVALRTEIVRISAGPYAAGDEIEVVARVVDAEGKPRVVGGGELTVTSATGYTRTVQAHTNRDGTIGATFALPAGGDATLTVIGLQPELGAREQLQGEIAPVSQRLQVSPCRLRTKVLTPAPHDALTPGSLMLVGELSRDGQRIGDPGALEGASLHFAVDFTSGSRQRIPATLANDGTWSGRIDLPTPAHDERFTVTLVAEGGAGDVCPGTSVDATLSQLGVAIDTSRLPRRCYVGRPCPIDVSLRLPESSAARPQAEAFVRHPGLAGSVSLSGAAPVPLQPAAADSFRADVVPGVPRELEVAVRFEAEGRSVEAFHTITVRWPLELKAPEELDLGTIQAGADWQQTCAMLDLSASRGLEEQELKVVAQSPEGCSGELVGNFGGLRASYAGGVTLEMDSTTQLPVCLLTSRCDADWSGQGVVLHLSSTAPEFADQKATVRVKYAVQGQGWLACHAWWLAVVLGSLLFGVVAFGFIVPREFGDDVLRVASKESALARSSARRFSEMPGGRRGWYRSARFGLRSDGSATDDLRSALVCFHARKGDVVISARGGLRRVDPRTRKLVDVPDPQEHSISRNAVYECGGLFFKVS